MANNDDQGMQDDFEPQGSFEETPMDDTSGNNGAGHQQMMSNVKEAWRTQPFFKLIVVMIAVAAVIAAVMSLTNSSSTAVPSRVAATPDLTEAPGGSATPAFIEAQKQAAAQRAAEAQRTGGSAMPTPVGTGISLNDLDGDGKDQADALIEFRDELARMQKQNQQQAQQIQQQIRQAPPYDEKLEQAMKQQMNQLLESWQPKKHIQLAGAEEKTDQVKGVGDDVTAAGATLSKILVPAGTVNYGQLLTEANSDVPGPILAQILSGPLAGARAVGSFQYFEEFLVLTFNLVSFKGKDYSINAIALDPGTTLGGMATEVDHRYWSRVILPAAAAFAQSFGSALSQGGTTVQTTGDVTITSQSEKGIEQGLYQGLSGAGQSINQYLQQEANKVKTLVRVAAGTPIGVFFTQSVTDSDFNQQQLQPYTAGNYPGQYSTGLAPGWGLNQLGGGAQNTGYNQAVGSLNQSGATVTNYPQGSGVYPGSTMTGGLAAPSNPNMAPR